MATRTTKSASKTTSTRRSTTTKAKTAAKPKTTAKRTAAKPKTASVASAPVVVDTPTPVVAGPEMRKKELIEAVVTRSGMKKKDVKPVVEAMLAVLGNALQDGRALNLQPMGKVKINREKKLASGRMLVARIRQKDAAKSAEETGASAATDAAGVQDKAAE